MNANFKEIIRFKYATITLNSRDDDGGGGGGG